LISINRKTDSASTISTFLNEKKILQQLQHVSGTPSLIDIFSDGDRECIVLDCVKGSTLRQIMLELGKGRMNAKLASRILFDLLSVLNKLHECQILHGNITIDSVQGVKRDGVFQARLFDFRSARLVNGQKADSGVFGGFQGAQRLVRKANTIS